MNEMFLLCHKVFLCSISVKKVCVEENNSEFWKLFDVECQRKLLDLTVNHELVRLYPIKKSYQQAFLKYVIKKLEEHETEICEELYNAYLYVLSEKTCNEEKVYKHYILPDDKYITLKESSSLISHGTTGLCTWQASQGLAEWCLNHPDLFNGKDVLELGSGIGLTGITLSLLLPLKRYHFSDVHPEVLENLCHNLRLNLERYGGQVLEIEDDAEVLFRSKIGGKTVEILKLPWEEASSSKCFPNTILAADVVYDPVVFPALINAFCYFLNLNKTCIVILACTVRNDQTLTAFLDMLASHGLGVNYEGVSSPSLFIYDKEPPVKIYKITS